MKVLEKMGNHKLLSYLKKKKKLPRNHLTDKWIIIHLLNTLNKGINAFDIFNADKVLKLSLLGVNKSYQRLGLATELCKLTIQIAQIRAVSGIIIEATSEYTFEIALSFGFEIIKEIANKDFELRDGSRPFALRLQELGEHRSVRLMARRLQFDGYKI